MNSSLSELTTNLTARIENEYSRLGHSLGWRLLASPVTTLGQSDIAFIGLNPAGTTAPLGHPKLAPSNGSAYVDEEWGGHQAGKSPLQRQIRLMFENLGVEPDTVLAGNLVPFRSPTWDALPRQAESLQFSCSLWRYLIDHARPRLVITMGAITTDAMNTLLDGITTDFVQLQWGSVRGSRGQFSGGTIVGLPHLSRFRVMGRPASVDALRQLFGPFWRAGYHVGLR
ncbi:uracil-DNA glycosylase family protein [Roseitalea porphyridii]|uniref:uracil-DNA glycosylase family protein n=1 Tax=Roseitalea porphyridii TaxID=1852022 RepID=UPI0035B5462E